MQTENEQNEPECPVCFDPLGNCFVQLCPAPQHRLCPTCFQGIQRKSYETVQCPCCRAESEFSVEPEAPKMLLYTAQKRNRYLQIGDRTIQVVVQTEKKMSEQRVRKIIASASNLIERMVRTQENEEDGEVITFTREDSEVEVQLNRNVLIFSL